MTTQTRTKVRMTRGKMRGINAIANDQGVISAAATRVPFIYLSAGVSDEIFRETLELAAESGVPFSGVLCGRATWQDGIPIYGKEGPDALRAWLLDRGVENIQALNRVLALGAKPWWDFYGGLDNIEVIDPVE